VTFANAGVGVAQASFRNSGAAEGYLREIVNRSQELLRLGARDSHARLKLPVLNRVRAIQDLVERVVQSAEFVARQPHDGRIATRLDEFHWPMMPRGAVGRRCGVLALPSLGHDVRVQRDERYPTKRPKPHETGVLAFSDSWQAWTPFPTESEARQHFADFEASLPPAAREERMTVRLILRGDTASERVLPPTSGVIPEHSRR
jgi:hypothetical protein